MKNLFAATTLFFFLITSCSKTVYIPVETVRTEYKNKIYRDSIFEKDSIYILHRGDTVFKDKYVLRYRDKLRIDTIYRDSLVQVPYEVQLPPIEKKVYPKWLVIFAIVGGCAVGYSGVKVYKILR